MPVAIRSSGGGATTLVATSSASDYTATLPANSGTVITTGSTGKVIPSAALPAGTILQVVSATKTDAFSTTSSTYTTITGLTVSITPTSATSKILIIANVTGSQTVNANDAYIALFRNSTQIALGDAAGNRPQSSSQLMVSNSGWSTCVGVNTLDSPATTSAITYSVQTKVANGNTSYINRGNVDQDVAFGAGRTVSSITAMEVAV